MDPIGSRKLRLAINLATHFPIEIINANSMQVYQGVLHHLLGIVSSNVKFTIKKFRDMQFLLLKELKSISIFFVVQPIVISKRKKFFKTELPQTSINIDFSIFI
ncbi:Uncharacterized protein TCM_027607 [Theobroma cacao]|uniref:Uncharacterized protein n=1 Tax=Theobroma cacao TaxID=3641 RepID=A0A061GGP0_THECC|nr:Uncharacterized protein TCM_027607 [Theobroma cacao]